MMDLLDDSSHQIFRRLSYMEYSYLVFFTLVGSCFSHQELIQEMFFPIQGLPILK